MSEPLLRVKDLVKNFLVRGGLLGREVGKVHAVDHVSFEVEQGDTLGVVGESGCGKSTTGRCLLRLIEPTSGEIWFAGKDVRALDRKALRSLRRDMQIIFQDPFASLNPRMTVGGIIAEALIIHALAKGRRELTDRVVELLETVGLEADHAQQLLDAQLPLPAARQPVVVERFGDDLADRHARVERGEGVLEDDLELPADLSQLPAAELGHILAFE